MSEPTVTTVRPDGREMAIVHGVFRRNLTDAPGQIHAVAPGDAARVGQLAGHYALVLDALHHHHAGEDELVWPLLRERAPGDTALVEAMETQHETVSELVETARALTRDWAASGDAAMGERLAAALTELADPLFTHLDQEETTAVPLICEYLSVSEWDRLRKHAMAQMAPEQLPLFLGMMLESATEADRAEFLAHMPPPMAADWAQRGQPAFAGYIAGIRN